MFNHPDDFGPGMLIGVSGVMLLAGVIIVWKDVLIGPISSGLNFSTVAIVFLSVGALLQVVGQAWMTLRHRKQETSS